MTSPFLFDIGNLKVATEISGLVTFWSHYLESRMMKKRLAVRQFSVTKSFSLKLASMIEIQFLVVKQSLQIICMIEVKLS